MNGNQPEGKRMLALARDLRDTLLMLCFLVGAAWPALCESDTFCTHNDGTCDRVFRVFESQQSENNTTKVTAHIGAAFTVISHRGGRNLSSAPVGNAEVTVGEPLALVFTEMADGKLGDTFFCEYEDIRVVYIPMSGHDIPSSVWCAKPHPKRDRVMEVLVVTPADCPQMDPPQYAKCATYQVKYCRRRHVRTDGLDCKSVKSDDSGGDQRGASLMLWSAPEEGTGTGGSYH